MKEKKARNHARAEGKTHTSISLREDVLAAARELAMKENRTLSNWLEVLLMDKIEEIERATRTDFDLDQN